MDFNVHEGQIKAQIDLLVMGRAVLLELRGFTANASLPLEQACRKIGANYNRRLQNARLNEKLTQKNVRKRVEIPKANIVHQ